MRSEDDGRGDDGRARLKADALPTIGTIGLATLLRVGAYEKPIAFSNCGEWRLCVRLVVKDLEAWIGANAATIERK
jgi:hypothetical protein